MAAAEARDADLFSAEAERAVIGAVLQSREALDECAELLRPTDFYAPINQRLFAAAIGLAAAGVAPDVVTVAEYFESRGELAAVGGLPALGVLVAEVGSTANAAAYAAIVRERWLRRAVIRVTQNAAARARHPDGETAAQILDQAQADLLALSATLRVDGPVAVADLLPDVLDRIDALAKGSHGGVVGLATGFRDLDQATAGLFPGELIVLAGRPSMGKTALALNIAENVALSGGAVAVFEMEMQSRELVQRLLASVAGVNLHRIRGGQIYEGEWPRLSAAAARLGGAAPLFVDPSVGLSPHELRTRCRRLQRTTGGLALVIVDYLQLMSVPGMRGDQRTAEVSEISRGLKQLAMELQVPVLALSQLNRAVESRMNKRPLPSDLRESGAIEQDADLILFLYRDEVYNSQSADAGTAELNVSKQRNGPTGVHRLTFLASVPRFRDFSGAQP